MEVADENSAFGTGMSAASAKKGKPRRPSGSPLAERACDGQGVASPSRKKAAANGDDSSSKAARARDSLEGGGGSRWSVGSYSENMADAFEIMDLLRGLDSPDARVNDPDKPDVQGAEVSTTVSSAGKEKYRKNRRQTAGYAAVQSLFDDAEETKTTTPQTGGAGELQTAFSRRESGGGAVATTASSAVKEKRRQNRRQTAELSAVQSLLDDAEETRTTPQTREAKELQTAFLHQESGGGAVATTASPAVKEKRRQNRRQTAELSAVQSLLGDVEETTTTPQTGGAGELQTEFPRRGSRDEGLSGVMAGVGGDETVGFSGLVGLAGEDAPGQPGGGGAASRVRARRYSNQKPGSDRRLASLVAPPSVPSGAGDGVVGGGGGGGGGAGKVPGPVNAQPRSPARRPRRSKSLRSSQVSAASSEDYALATPELQYRPGQGRSPERSFEQCEDEDNAADVGVNLSTLSVDSDNMSVASDTADDEDDGNPGEGGNTVDDEDGGNPGDGDTTADDEDYGNPGERDNTASINMDDFVSELGVGSGLGGGGRSGGSGSSKQENRRATAESYQVESLLESINGIFDGVSAGNGREAGPAARSGVAVYEVSGVVGVVVVEDGGSDPWGDAEGARAGEEVTPSGSRETPKSSKRKKSRRSSRRESADLVTVQGLFDYIDEAVVPPSGASAAATATATATVAESAELGMPLATLRGATAAAAASAITETSCDGEETPGDGEEMPGGCGETPAGCSDPTVERVKLPGVNRRGDEYVADAGVAGGSSVSDGSDGAHTAGYEAVLDLVSTCETRASSRERGGSASAVEGEAVGGRGLRSSGNGDAGRRLSSIEDSFCASELLKLLASTPDASERAGGGGKLAVGLGGAREVGTPGSASSYSSLSASYLQSPEMRAGSVSDADGGRDGGGARRESGQTAVGRSMLGLLEYTPSPGGRELDQSVADGSALRGRTLAPLQDREGGVEAGSDDSGRRATCEPAQFQDIIRDLASTTGSSSPASSAGKSVATGSEWSSSSPRDGKFSESWSSFSSPSGDSPSNAVTSGADGAKRAGRGGTDTSDVLTSDATPADAKVKTRGKKMTQKEKDKQARRSTASPAAVDKLMMLIDENVVGETEGEVVEEEEAQDTQDTDAIMEAHVSSVNSSSGASDGELETPSPVSKTPSPPVALRTRSKSPASLKEAAMEAKMGGDGSTASQRSGSKKRTSVFMSPEPEKTAAATKQVPPEFARGKLKSCLSSRKRPCGRGVGGTAPFSDGGGSNFALPETPDASSRGTYGRALMSPSSSSRGTSAGGGGGGGGAAGFKTPGPAGVGSAAAGAVSDVGLETPRRVMFGAPMAAEFNHLSPSNRLTPMPSRDAKSLFPVEKQEDDDTDHDDEDEDTAANSKQLAEWEGVPLAGEDMEKFEAFDGGGNDNDGEGREKEGGREGPGEEAIFKASPSPSRSRRRQSLAAKSPLRYSIAAFSENVRGAETSTGLSPVNSDSESLAIDNLNASISGPPARASAPAAGAMDVRNMSFSINTRDMQGLGDSDSSIELTGTFGAALETDDAVAPGTAAAPARAAAAAVEPVGEGGGDRNDVNSMDLNDSCELVETLYGASIRDAVSPGPRRSSLLDVMSEVDEYEEEVLSQAQDEGEVEREGAEDEMASREGGGGGEMEALHSDTESMDTSSDEDRRESGAGEAQPEAGEQSEPIWESILGKENARLATVREEMSPGGMAVLSCSSPTVSLDAIAVLKEDFATSNAEVEGSNGAREGPASMRRETLSPPEVRRGSGSSAIPDATVESPSSFAGMLADLDEEGVGGVIVPSMKGVSSSGRSVSYCGPGADPTVKLLADVAGSACNDRGYLSTVGRRASSALESGSKRGNRRMSVSGPLSDATVELRMDIGGSVCNDMRYTDDVGRAPSALASSRRGNRRTSVSGPLADPTVELRMDIGGSVCNDKRYTDNVGRAPSALASSRRGSRRISVSGPLADPTVEIPAHVSHAVCKDGSYERTTARKLSGGMPDGGAGAGSVLSGDGPAVSKRRRSSIADIEMEVDDPQDVSDRTTVSSGAASAAIGAAAGSPEAETRRPRESTAGLSLPDADDGTAAGVLSTADSRGRGEDVADGFGGDRRSSATAVEAVVREADDGDERRGILTEDAPVAVGEGGAAGGGGMVPRGAVVDGTRPPRHSSRERVSLPYTASSSPGSKSGVAGGIGRRASLQTVMGSRWRVSIAPVSTSAPAPPTTAVGASGSADQGDGESIGLLKIRRRLSSMGGGEVTPSADEMERERVEVSVGPGVDGAGEGDRGVVEEDAREQEEEEEEEEVTLLVMSVDDLVKFVAPDMAATEGPSIASVVVPHEDDGVFGQRMGGLPESMVHAMADTLNAAASEMEDKMAVAREHAAASAEAAWEFHTDAPVLGEIDRAIAEGVDVEACGEGSMPVRAREIAVQIKAGLEREWAAWEVQVLERMKSVTDKAHADLLLRRQAYTSREEELEVMASHCELADHAVMLEEYRANVRSRMEDGAGKIAEVTSDVSSLEAELANLRREKEEALLKKAALEEEKAAREARSKAAAARSRSVVQLMELEAEGIRMEGESLALKEMFDAQLGLRLWCQPVTLLPGEVVVAFAAPHDTRLQTQLAFCLGEGSKVTAEVLSVQRAAAQLAKGVMVTVGDKNSASGRLSRLIFEGCSGIFSTGATVGAAVSGLAGVTCVADLTAQTRNAEWFVGRAYGLLEEVHNLEKKHAVTAMESEFAEGGAVGAMMCVEVANWKTRVTLRLRFRVATSYACCVGGPEVEVDIGSLKAETVMKAIRQAGAHQSGMMCVTRAVEAAVACING